MGDWTGMFCAFVVILCGAIFIKASKKALTLICIVALIVWLVKYGIPAFG